MTKAEWESCETPKEMLDWLYHNHEPLYWKARNYSCQMTIEGKAPIPAHEHLSKYAQFIRDSVNPFEDIL